MYENRHKQETIRNYQIGYIALGFEKKQGTCLISNSETKKVPLT